MLSTVCVAVFLVAHIISIEATRINTFYGIKTNVFPKSSCNKISNKITESECLGHCIFTRNIIAMISHDESTSTCMCCSDIIGDEVGGPNWKSYVPRKLPCANGYVTYDLMSYQICLRYFPVPVTYESPRARCQAKGADLIKIDSQEKFKIFKDYHAPIADNTLIQVWIESIKVKGQWQFHDGSPMPNVSHIGMRGRQEEVHVRVRVRNSTSLYYDDAPDSKLFHYSCEYSP